MNARLILAAVLLSPAGAGAQPLFRSILSLEAQALNSRSICVGRILSLDSQAHVNAVVQVEQVVKGMAVGKMGLLLEGSREQLEAWRKSKARLLIFDDLTLDLGDPQLEMFAADGSVLKSAHDIIVAARRITEENPGVFGMQLVHRSEINFASQPRGLRGGVIPRLVVPADRKFERWCYDTIANSKDQMERARAAGSLGMFPGERATAMLRKLLSDPGTVQVSPGKHRYVVRIWAWETLKNWDDKVPKPVEFRQDK